jgi:PAS domain S-box-containing protein
MDDRASSALPFAIDSDGLLDFWTVYQRRFEEVQRVALAFAYEHAELGPIVRSMSDEQLAAQNQRSRTMLRDAMASGDWSTYVADIRQQGTHYAKLGLSFTSWYGVMRIAHETLVPALVESYGKTPARLSKALAAMVGFFDGAMSVLAEQYLDAKENDRARLLVASLKDCALIMLDPQGHVASWNLGAKDLLGYEPEEIVGAHFSVFYPSDEKECSRPERELEVATGQGRFEYDGWRVRKDGSRFWANVVVTPMRDGRGRPLGYAKIMRDLSERRNAELELRAAKEAAEAANRELEAFSYSVAHDLRAPLRGMNGFANVLVEDYEDEIDDEGRDALAEIQRNAVRMGALIDGLLSLARVARSELALADVDLTALARSITDQLTAASPGRAVEVIAQPGLVAHADPLLTRTLLQNLLENAWKFTDKTPFARIEVGAVTHQGQEAFFVRDNGAGFDPAYASKLFAPFQRLHTLSEFPGTGIGLATVQRVVRRHGGRVWAEGSVGAGATFHFTLAPPGQRGFA